MKKMIAAVVLALLPLSAQATIMTDKLAAVCASDNPACQIYTLGGAERVWLVSGDSKKCDAAADKKAVEGLMTAAKGKTGFYQTEKPEPGAVALLEYINKNKVKSCSLATRYSDIVKRCASPAAGDQNACHAYVAGVMDMALIMDQVHQAREAKGKNVPLKPPFCQAGQPKMNMTDDEVMKSLGDWGKKHADDSAKIPAAAGIIEAMLDTYPCPKTTDKK
jgi:hypothetical protein